MNLPDFIIKLDRKLDFEISEEMLGIFSELQISDDPPVTNEKELRAIFDFYYNENPEGLNEAKKFLVDSQPTLRKIADLISEQLDYPWDGIERVTIIPALCPLAPRFIEKSTFMVPFYAEKNWILKVCAHEMTHFLYFKKIQDQLGTSVETEQPSSDWLLSEIVAPVVVNSPSVQSIVNERDAFFLSWRE